jgi:LmbE family N-acetylglucosaminyl deacetylase/SAM-dependent methyltransferase
VSTFTHRDAGTAEDDWLARLAIAPRLPAPGAGDIVVVIAAHPDDETLGAGGTIAAAAAAGATVRVVIATDGEASHPDSPTHDRALLGSRRRDEVRTALAALNPKLRPVLLGLPDGALAEHERALAAAVARHLEGATYVLAPWSGDRHPDHEACAAAVTAVLGDRTDVARWEYPLWAWHWAAPAALPWDRIGSVGVPGEFRARKRMALAAFVSQHTALSPAPGDDAVLPAPVLAHFDRDVEAFVVTSAAAVNPGYFDALYERCDDPWGLADRFYERRKRELLLAALPRASFVRAFEPGCATGETSVRLGERCAELVCWDVAPAAVCRTRARCGPAVCVECAAIPDDWPAGQFDLIVLSEIGYYCRDLSVLVARVRSSLAPDGVVAACHWRRAAPDHPHSGDAVHQALRRGLGELQHAVRHAEPDFLLDVWSRSTASVAQAEGIAP